MFDYFGWDYDSIKNDVIPETINIIINDEFINNYYTKTWNNCDTSKDTLIKELEKINLEYNKQYTFVVIEKQSKHWYSVRINDNTRFSFPL